MIRKNIATVVFIGWLCLCSALSLPAKGRFSLNFSGGLNYLAVGDSNSYFVNFNRRFANVVDRLETFHSGVDLNAEIGYRITPRLEVAIGLGLVRDSLMNNDLSIRDQFMGIPIYRFGVVMKTIPLQLVFHYRMGSSARFSYGVHAAILFNFASWSMQSDYYLTDYIRSTFWNSERENATGLGLGVTAGGRGEWKLGEHVAFTVDIFGRYAPLRNFSGQRQFYYGQSATPPSSRGELWFFEYYDTSLSRWTWELGIGGRPVGPGTRNVSRATVDFSGLALRAGLLFRF